MNTLLTDFLDSPQKTTWLNMVRGSTRLSVYVRKSRRYLEGRLQDAIDIATANAYPQGTGLFTAFVEKVEQIAKERDLIVFVESILNEQLISFFVRRGYKPQFGEACLPGYSLYLQPGNIKKP